MNQQASAVEKHYSNWPTLEMILENLRRKGVDLSHVRPSDLYPYDQSHAGGIEAAAMLAQRAGIQACDLVIDVGCGTGGAARYLHSEFSCRVLGVDLTLERLRTGMALDRLVGVTGVDLIAGSADALPLPSHCADVVWTQHLTMNLPNPASFLRECARILNQDGRLACHEWFLARPDPAARLPFPLPWAPGPSLNHAILTEQFLAMIGEQNFVPASEDVTAAMATSLQKDIRMMTARGFPEERIAARGNLLQAAREGLLQCLMITASRS